MNNNKANIGYNIYISSTTRISPWKTKISHLGNIPLLGTTALWENDIPKL